MTREMRGDTWRKHDQIVSFLDLRNKTLEVQERSLPVEERNAWSGEMEVEAKLITEENEIMMDDLQIIDPAQRAWFERSKWSSDNTMRSQFSRIYLILCISMKLGSSETCVRYYGM
jgi:hypothetical protein